MNFNETVNWQTIVTIPMLEKSQMIKTPMIRAMAHSRYYVRLQRQEGTILTGSKSEPSLKAIARSHPSNLPSAIAEHADSAMRAQ